jgi:very-short-patch-repair endonuclease
MRREMTEPETRLWLALRDRRLVGAKFSRQVVVGSYIADFCARSLKLVIEVDGDTHADQSRDQRRTAWLEAQGYRVIRFTNQDVATNLEGVLQVIVSVTAIPHPTLSPQGRGLKK